MTGKHTVFHIFTGIIITMFIISAAVTLALNFRFIYNADIERYNLEEISGLTAEELKVDYNELIDYNCIWGDNTLDFTHFTLSDNFLAGSEFQQGSRCLILLRKITFI